MIAPVHSSARKNGSMNSRAMNFDRRTNNRFRQFRCFRKQRLPAFLRVLGALL